MIIRKVKKENLRNRFTEKGFKDLTKKLKFYIKIYNGDDEKFTYGEKIMILGFGSVILNNKTEVKYRIYELAGILGIKLSEEEYISVSDNRQEMIKHKINMEAE